jgi:hypothetical protein
LLRCQGKAYLLYQYDDFRTDMGPTTSTVVRLFFNTVGWCLRKATNYLSLIGSFSSMNSIYWKVDSVGNGHFRFHLHELLGISLVIENICH